MVRSKKLVSMALCLAMTATVFSGCGKKGSNKSGSTYEADYDHIFREEEYKLSEDVDTKDLYNMISNGSRVVAYGSTYDENSDYSDYKVVSFNTDGSDVKQITISGKPDEGNGSIYVSNIEVDPEGNLYALKDETLFSGDSESDEDYESVETYYIAKYTADGEEVFSAKLDGGEDYVYYSGLFYIEGKGVLVYDDTHLYLYSADDGSLIKNYDTGLEYIYEIVPKGDVVLVYYYDENGYKLKEFSLDEGKFTGDAEFPGSMMNYNSFIPGTCSDLLLTASGGIYTYNFGDPEVTYVCSYIDSDINPDDVSGVAQISETEFLLLVSEQTDDDYTYKFTKIVKVPAEEAKSQEIITLACYWMDYNLRNAVVDFNKSNSKYRISVKDYSMYDTDDDYNAGVTKLNTDIVSGEIPDIIVSSIEMPMESYASKGLFMDLDPLIEKDDSFNMDDYLKNIIDSFRRDGKLYSLVPSFSVYTIAAASSNLGGKTSWTMKEMKQIADSKGIAYKDMFGIGYTREEIMEMAIYLNASTYIDWDNQKCSFDSEEFKEFLAFLKELPEKLDDSVYSTDDSDYWRKGKALANLMYMSSFSDYRYQLRGTFGEPVTLIGFPTNGTSGSAIIPNNEICISANTTKEDGCWEFIKSLFGDAYQKEIADYGEFPVKRSIFNEMVTDSMKSDTWINEDGVEESYDETATIGGKDIEITPLTQEEADYVVSFIESLTDHVVYDKEILNIISEEAAAYFSDQKSVDDVASIIQNRISIYVNENS